MNHRTCAAVLATVLAVTVPACSSEQAAPTGPPPVGDKCLVLLHGKGARGENPSVDGTGIVKLVPNGNERDGDGRKWIYFPEDKYTAAVAVVQSAIEASQCKQVILGGFSNGAAFAAKLYCRGERFGETVISYVVDDPVPDGATQDCTPTAGTTVALFWTGGLAGTAQPGWDCSEDGWICEGGTTVGIDAYASALGTAAVQSARTKHEFWSENPALTAWP